MRKLNPFRGLPNPREVWAWGMYDLANQSFTLLVVTLFFSIYFQNRIAATPDQGKAMWGFAIGASSLVVVVLGPLLGALADFGGKKKAWLTILCLGCSFLTIALAFTGPGLLWTAFILFVLANVMFMGGENFLAAFLPEISTRETMSRVSAIGWTMGYLGAMLVLPIAGLILVLTNQSDLGFKLVFAFAGLWFLFAAVPTFLYLKERKQPEPLPPRQTIATIGFSRLWSTVKQAPLYRQLLIFLSAFFVYSCGMSIIIGFAGELAYQYLGAGTAFLLFCWILSLVAGVGSIITGFFQIRLGHKLTLGLSLALWIAVCIGAALLPAPGSGGATWLIWVIGAGMGFGLGMTGNASRTLVGVFTPAHKTAEFFGLWGLAYKLASVVGPPLYGIVHARAGQPAAMALVAAFFALGLLGLLFVQVTTGEHAARQAEQDFAGGGTSAACPNCKYSRFGLHPPTPCPECGWSPTTTPPQPSPLS